MARLRSIRRLLLKLGQVGARRRLLLLEAALLLLLARLALLVLPFPKIAARLGHFVAPSDARKRKLKAPHEKQAAVASEIGWAVTRAARYLPFEAVCLPQAMAARVMLKRRGVASVMHFGAATGKVKPFDTHAWLDAAGVEVTGYPVGADFAEIACFV